MTDLSAQPVAATGELLAPVPADAEQFELIIEPRRGWIGIDWGELVRYRELLYFLVWRDVKVRYKQTVLGVAWAIMRLDPPKMIVKAIMLKTGRGCTRAICTAATLTT
jgi:lipopolysaccharide transport system permease protein